jgi:transposase-like protein
LDYYHACEHLHDFVENGMKSEPIELRKKWIEKQKELLLESSVNQVIKNIKQTKAKAIESAHKTVIQERMKLSGQHWSRDGATNMLRLRVISMNKQWGKVINLLRKPNTKAA